MNITAWAAVAPWAELRQIEQDLIISRALVELFRDDFLRQELRFRGGTALNKIHFPAPLRYSEDIDLVRTTHGPIKQLLSRIREVLEPWLGKAEFEQSRVAPKLIFEADAEDGGAPLRLRLEINTREMQAFDAPHEIAFAVDNPWFLGEAAIPTCSREEMSATKLRALLQRDKGRDLLDLSHALAVFDGLDASRVAELLHLYLAPKLRLSRAQAEERMFAKLADPGFLVDVRPLLSPEEAERLTDEAIKAVLWFRIVHQNDEILALIRNEVVTDAAGQRTWAGSFVNTNDRTLRDVAVTVDFLDSPDRTVGKVEAEAAELPFSRRLDLQAPLPPDAVRLRIYSVQWRMDRTAALMGPFREPWEFGYLMVDPVNIDCASHTTCVAAFAMGFSDFMPGS